MTRENNLYDQLYQSNVFGKESSKNKVFHVTIGNSKNVEMHDFHPHEPEIKYFQNEENTCVFSSLYSDLFSENEHYVEHAVLSQLSSYLSCDTVGYMNRIRFSTKILTDGVRNKGEQQRHYKVV